MKTFYEKTHRDVVFEFDDKLSVGRGVTYYDSSNNIRHIKVGIQVNDKNGPTDFDYIQGMRVIIHEFRHVDQWMSNFNVCGKYASEFRIDDLARSCSDVYYGFVPHIKKPLDQYWTNISELDAECAATNGLLKFLANKGLFPDIKNPEAIIVQYMNECCKEGDENHRSYYLRSSKDFTSLSEINRAFKKQIMETIYANDKNYRPLVKENSHLGIMMAQNVKPWD